MVKFIIYLIKLILAIFVSIFFSSCRFNGDFDGIKGSGNVITETRNTEEDFNKVEANSGIHVVIEQADSISIVVEADDNIISHILTRFENNTLIVDTDDGFNTENTPKVTVKMPIISGLSATGGSKITTNNRLITDQIKVNSNSGSQVEAEVEADFISIETSSGSSTAVSGIALKQETTATSGSEINTSDLNTNEVYANGSSGSSTSVNPIVKLNAKASSGASIVYKKTPKILTKKESSGGSISAHF